MNDIPKDLEEHLMAIAEHCKKQRPPCSECDLVNFCPIVFNYSPEMWVHLINMDRVGESLIEGYEEELREKRYE